MSNMARAGGFGVIQPQDQGTNLWSIILNIAFGFVIGLMIFIGAKQIINYGSKLATMFIKMSGYGKPAAMFGFSGFASAAPYIVLAPLGGIVIKQLSSVKTLKGFGYFAAAVIVGSAIAFFTKGSVVSYFA